MNIDEWKHLAWDAYVREPDYRLAASMVLALRYAVTSADYAKIAFTGLASRILCREGI